MLKKIKHAGKYFLSSLKKSRYALNVQVAYEITNVSFDVTKNQHWIEVKLTGKAQSTCYEAQELASSTRLLKKFSTEDSRTIVYLATCDQLTMNHKEKNRTSIYRLFRPQHNKTDQGRVMGIEHRISGKIMIKPINELLNPFFLEQLDVLDVYYLGHIMGQEQCIKKTDNTFSYQFTEYAIYRPQYPKVLFDYLAQLVDAASIVLECGAGSGQATLGFSAEFQHVVALDASYTLLSNATQQSNVLYVQSSAEKLPLSNCSVSLVCIAQAVHWFSLDHFYAEVQRVLKPNGFFAVWCYNQAIITSEIDAITKTLYDKMRSDQPVSIERQYVYDSYKTLPFPYQKIATPSFEMCVEWDFHQWLGYLNTWPSVLEYQKHYRENPVQLLQADLLSAWKDPVIKRHITWPIYLLVGRKDSALSGID